MTWTQCEVYWDLDFEPSETSGGQPVASIFGIRLIIFVFHEPVSADHVQAKAGPGPIFETFFWPLSRRILFETTQILEPFWFLFLGLELYQVMALYHLLDDLAAQVGPEKMHFVAECR